jgi:formylglycine-generating enzyme required for sulfatase activity
MRWEPPPSGRPTSLRGDEQTDDEEFDPAEFMLAEANKIRLQYCEDGALAAADWHGHAGVLAGMVAPPPRDDPRGPVTYERKPMVAVAWQEAEQLANRLSDEGVTYRLPTEAEWEAAARGGLVGRRYPWGDEPPTPEVCDFGRFDEFAIGPTRRRPPNGYGLHGMSGGVWEWTADWYDAEYYAESPADDPTGPPTGLERCLRGGSWADCAEVATVSFRTSRPATPWWEGEWGKQLTPNIGFRLCRVEDR